MVGTEQQQTVRRDPVRPRRVHARLRPVPELRPRSRNDAAETPERPSHVREFNATGNDKLPTALALTVLPCSKDKTLQRFGLNNDSTLPGLENSSLDEITRHIFNTLEIKPSPCQAYCCNESALVIVERCKGIPHNLLVLLAQIMILIRVS